MEALSEGICLLYICIYIYILYIYLLYIYYIYIYIYSAKIRRQLLENFFNEKVITLRNMQKLLSSTS